MSLPTHMYQEMGACAGMSLVSDPGTGALKLPAWFGTASLAMLGVNALATSRVAANAIDEAIFCMAYSSRR